MARGRRDGIIRHAIADGTRHVDGGSRRGDERRRGAPGCDRAAHDKAGECVAEAAERLECSTVERHGIDDLVTRGDSHQPARVDGKAHRHIGGSGVAKAAVGV